MATINRDTIIEAYDDVRSDNTETSWFTMSYGEGNCIDVTATGTEYSEFLNHFAADQRVYGYVRIVSGDEMSKRSKFVFISWSGPDVGAIKRAKVGVDKTTVKQVVKNFAIEINSDDRSELEYDAVVDLARKAGGANYGTGSR